MSDTAAPQVERRLDAGYIRRLLEDTHDCAYKTWKRMFEGNGEPAMIVEMAMIKADQERQQIDQDRQRGEMDKQKELLDAQTKAMIAVQQTLLLITSAASKIGVVLLCAAVVGVVGIVWSMITHQAIWFQP
jgi:hypothetical protein